MFIHRAMSIKEYHQIVLIPTEQIMYILDIIDKCPEEGGGGIPVFIQYGEYLEQNY